MSTEMIVGDTRKYVLLNTRSLIGKIRQQYDESLCEVYERVQTLVKWNTFRDWAYRGWSRMPLSVFTRLKKHYKLTDSPEIVTEKQWYKRTRRRAAKTMHESYLEKDWLSRAAKSGGEAVKRKYGVRYLTELSKRAIHSSSKHRYEDEEGIRYRSRIELHVAQLLRKNNIMFIYEPEIEGCIPDFQIKNTIIEVCGYFRDPDYLPRLHSKLENLTQKGWQIILICEPRNKAALLQAVTGVPVMFIMTTDEFRRWLTSGNAVASSWRELSS